MHEGDDINIQPKKKWDWSLNIHTKKKKIPVVRILLVTQHLEIERDAVSCLYDIVVKKKKMEVEIVTKRQEVLNDESM